MSCDDKFSISYVASYSLTKPYEATQISKYIIEKINEHLAKSSYDCIITDGTAGSGGDCINFSKYFKKINAVEIRIEMFNLLKRCAQSKNNISFYNDDYLHIYNKLDQDIIYLDPPWGGTDYKFRHTVELKLSEIPLYKIINDLLFYNKKDAAEAKEEKKTKIGIIIFVKAPLNVCTKNMDIKDSSLIYNKSGIPSFKLLTFF